MTVDELKAQIAADNRAIASIRAKRTKIAVQAKRDRTTRAEEIAGVNQRIAETADELRRKNERIERLGRLIRFHRFDKSNHDAAERADMWSREPRSTLPDPHTEDGEAYWAALGGHVVLDTFILMRLEGHWPDVDIVVGWLCHYRALTEELARQVVAHELARPDTPLQVKIDESSGFQLAVVADQSLYDHLDELMDHWENVEDQASEGWFRAAHGDLDPFGVEDDRAYFQERNK